MIKIRGAYQNNIKNIDIDIPKHRWVVFTGVSGSGKSTLVYDIVYSQAQKEFLESLSTYARRSFPKIHDVECREIEGLSPCIVIDQSSFPNTPRSTVGTYTEIYSYLRLLFSRAGDSNLSAAEFSFNNAQGACDVCNGLGEALQPYMDRLINQELSLNEGAILHRTWKVGSRYWNIIRAIGYFDMDKKLKDFNEEELDKLLYAEPFVYQNDEPGHVQSFSYEGIIRRLKKRKNDERGLSAVDYDDAFFINCVCPKCKGARLNQRALEVKISGKYTISELVNMEIQDLYELLRTIHGEVEDVILPVILKALKGIIDVGMGYITLNRSAYTLSNGEAQKIKLAKQLGCSLSDIIYILDEPSAGLHAIDISRMNTIVRSLVDKHNSVLMIEHNQYLINQADYIIDMGPGAGKNGGKILFQGTIEEIAKSQDSVTGPYLSEQQIQIKRTVRKPKKYFTLKNINKYNVSLEVLDLPRDVFLCISGVSGSGKSTLLEAFIEQVPRTIIVDQDMVGANVRSNAMTYTKIFTDIRDYFSKNTGVPASMFSYNSDGCCPNCNGLGYTITDMHFMGDVKTLCEECEGKRYKEEILKLKIRDKNISDVLDMSIEEAMEYFSDEREIYRRLNLINDVGLGYLTLGQPLSTYSGGELQRLKLASKIQSKGNIYIFDEPTRGLHFKDADRLMGVLERLVEAGNSVIVVEHNLKIIAQADYIVDMGPLGGKNGGKILFQGTPRELIECKDSYTAQYLRRFSCCR